MVFQSLKGSCKEDRGSLFTRSHLEKIQGNRCNLYRERFYHDMRKEFFTAKSIIQWKNLPRDVVETPALEVFKVQLDRVLDNLI